MRKGLFYLHPDPQWGQIYLILHTLTTITATRNDCKHGLKIDPGLSLHPFSAAAASDTGSPLLRVWAGTDIF